MLVGAYRRWKWLVDPPLSWSPYYSQAACKEMFGTDFTRYFTYFLGIVFLAASSVGTYQQIAWCVLISRPPPHWIRPSS